MTHSGIISLKILFILALFIGFSFIVIEQRLESKNLDYQLLNLQKDLETLNLKKREVSIKINSELARLSSYDYSKMGVPLSMKDIVYISLPDMNETRFNGQAAGSEDNLSKNMDYLIRRIFKDKINLSE